MRILGIVLALAVSVHAQSSDVLLSFRIVQDGQVQKDGSGIVVWLTPEDGHPALPGRFHLFQRDKTFKPHLLVVPLGSAVEFPNFDPLFHNVFSLFEGKRFDLGLYESGQSRTIHFDRSGVSYLFCNIHPDMSAVVVVVNSPHYAVSDRSGSLTIKEVPAGLYKLNVWHEKADAAALAKLSRSVRFAEGSTNLGTIQIATSGRPALHSNKYGQPYVKPDPAASAYPK